MNENVQELIVVANEGYAFTFDTKEKLKDLAAKRDGNSSEPFGLSGYNNTYKSMQTLVIGQGPDLAQGGIVLPVKNAQDQKQVRVVDLFVLLCNILDVKCPKSSGNASRIDAMLRYSTVRNVRKTLSTWISIAFEPQNAPVTSKLERNQNNFCELRYIDKETQAYETDCLLSLQLLLVFFL